MGVSCIVCNKVFAHQSNYNRHLRQIHGVDHKVIIEHEYGVSLFKCEDCRLSFKRNQYLRQHLSQKHDLKIGNSEELSFNSYQEFHNWLSCEETMNNIKFERLTGVKRTRNSEISKLYLNCARSGKVPKPICDRKRVPKGQGSKKLNFYCTSQIIVNLYKCGKCEVKYFKTHYGHDNHLQHLKISKTKKDIMASKFILSVSTEKDNIVNEDVWPGSCPAKNKIEDEAELKMLVSDSTLVLPSKPSKEKIIREIELNLLEVISKIKNEEHSDEQLLFVLEKSKNIKRVMNNEIGNNSKLKDIKIKQEPPNKNIDKQSFYSTKKRKYKFNNNKKANREEQEIIEETLTVTEIILNNSLYDHNYL